MQLSIATCLSGRCAQAGDSCIDVICFIVFVAAVSGGHGTKPALPDENDVTAMLTYCGMQGQCRTVTWLIS